MRQISAAGLALVKEFEGFRSNAYVDPVGVWTIGYGHTEGVRPGDFVTLEQASEMLADELTKFGQGVEDLLSSPPTTTDNEFAAMVSLAYNIGIGAFRGSSVCSLHNGGKRQDAARAFLLWNKGRVNGEIVELPGLTRRRKAEAALYLGRPVAAAVDPSAPTVHMIKRGAWGQRVRDLQAALNGAGITPALRCDGDFGALTEANVKAFQKAHGLVDDGIAGPATLAKLGL